VLATGLAVEPLAIAMAFTVAVLLSEKGPEYSVELEVGVVPLVV
jgi:hypothetical protein